MRHDLELSSAEVSGAFTIAVLVKGAVDVPVGHWVDRHGARAAMTVGSVGATLSVIAWSQVHSLLELYAVFTAIGVFSAGVLYEPAFAVVVRWFRRDRAAAILAITMVSGLAPTVFAPLSNVLIEAWSWRAALLVLAVVLAVVTVVPHALLVRSGPPDVGLQPDGTPMSERAGTAAAPEARAATSLWATLASAARDRRFRWFTMAYSANTFAVAVVIVHLVPYLRASGQSGGVAVTALASLGVLSLVGRVALTVASRLWGMRRASAGSFTARAGAALVLLALPGSTAAIAAFVVAFGLSSGIGTIGKATLLADAFGTTGYA